MCLKVDKEKSVYRVNIAKNVNVNLNTLFIFCRPKAQFEFIVLKMV